MSFKIDIMKKKSSVDLEDIETFKSAVKGAKRLTSDKVRLTRPLPAPRQKTIEPDDDTFLFMDNDQPPTLLGEDKLSYKQESLSDKLLRKLSKGQYNVEAVLDLHGKTVEKARIAVNQFLKTCLQEGVQVALIIHGKGYHGQMPILKNKLNLWLREINAVLAFCSAAPCHGNRGALYVLLKRSREEKSVWTKKI